MTKENLNKNSSETKKTFSDVKDTSKSILSDENIAQFTSQLTEELIDFLQSKKDNAIGVKNKCKDQIKENPFLTIIGALTIGIILGMIFKK